MIRIALGHRQQGRKLWRTSKMIYKFDSVGSTNNVAKEYGFGDVIVAKEQTSGRGRFKRKWSSNQGGLWFSIVVKPERRLFEYTFIAAIAMLRSIDVRASIKWPNDIVYEGKKICGILSEAIIRGSKAEKIIVGIGLNVNNSVPSELNSIALCLKEIKKKEIDLDLLLDKIISNFKKLSKRDFNCILKEYKKNCSILQRKIVVKAIDKEIKGRAVDITDDGELVLEFNGKKVKLNEGDVSME